MVTVSKTNAFQLLDFKPVQLINCQSIADICPLTLSAMFASKSRSTFTLSIAVTAATINTFTSPVAIPLHVCYKIMQSTFWATYKIVFSMRWSLISILNDHGCMLLLHNKLKFTSNHFKINQIYSATVIKPG